MTAGTQVARFLTRHPATGALLGSGVGAAVGAVRTPLEGETRLQAAQRGAVRGALVGGAASGLGRAYRDTRLLKPWLTAGEAGVETARRLTKSVADVGRRQVHGFTGRYNHDAIGMAGNATAAREATLIRARARDEAKHLTGDKARKVLERADQQIKETLEAGRRSQDLQRAGVTTLPGIYRALKSPETRRQALRAMGRSITAGPGGAALSVGLPVATSAPSLLRGDESAYGGKTTRQKLLELGASIGTGAAVGGLPVVPQLVAGTALDAATRRVVSGKAQQ